MAKFNSFFKVFNFFLPFTDFVYILQLEEYSSKRLLHWLPRFFFRRNIQKRERLVLTARAKLTVLLSFLGWGLGFVSGFLLINLLTVKLLHIVLSFLIIPFAVLIANSLLSLFEEIPRKRIRERAAQLVAQNISMKVIAIAGSYGKTTTKNFINQLVHYTYRTQMIPGNINTPAGIANWINANLRKDTELLIAEVDAYQIGEIARSCTVLNADIAILTNIGDQHLERFASLDDLKMALSEVFLHSKPNAVLITLDDTKQQLPLDLQNRVQAIAPPRTDQLTYGAIAVNTKALSESNRINVAFALEAAKRLQVPENIVKDTISKLELPDRRQQQTTVLGFAGIDDSYNISFSTAKAGIDTAQALAKKMNKNLLVITAGIPELSPKDKVHNKELGSLLEKSADHTIILNSVFADEVSQGFSSEMSFTRVPSLDEFISNETQNFKKEDWVLLLQPELNDLYY